MSRTPISLELRFLRIPTIWNRQKGVFHDEHGEHTEYFFAPEVRQDVERRFVIEDNPWKLRNEFLRMKHTEEAALQFLAHVGVWNAVPGQESQGNLPKTILSGAFGFRVFQGCARPLTLEELWTSKRDGRKDSRIPRSCELNSDHLRKKVRYHTSTSVSLLTHTLRTHFPLIWNGKAVRTQLSNLLRDENYSSPRPGLILSAGQTFRSVKIAGYLLRGRTNECSALRMLDGEDHLRAPTW